MYEYHAVKFTGSLLRLDSSPEDSHAMPVITAIQFVKKVSPDRPLTVIGAGCRGLTAVLACAVTGEADTVVADLNGADPGYDGELLSLLPCSGIKRIGDFRTATLLLMDHPRTLTNAGATFDREWYERMATAVGMEGKVRISGMADSEKK